MCVCVRERGVIDNQEKERGREGEREREGGRQRETEVYWQSIRERQ